MCFLGYDATEAQRSRRWHIWHLAWCIFLAATFYHCSPRHAHTQNDCSTITCIVAASNHSYSVDSTAWHGQSRIKPPIGTSKWRTVPFILNTFKIRCHLTGYWQKLRKIWQEQSLQPFFFFFCIGVPFASKHSGSQIYANFWASLLQNRTMGYEAQCSTEGPRSTLTTWDLLRHS